MSLILSGTDGLSDVDGSAATPAIRGTDANTGIFFGADIIGFAEGGAEVARFNADAQFVAAAGTASLPVITTTGDVNTGIFFPAADTIAFSEGGVESMRIDSSGNVGIGTTSPAQRLHVDNSANSSTWTKVSNGSNGAGAAAGILIGTDQGDAGALSQNSSGNTSPAANALRLRNLLSAPITFETNGTERARIDSSGNLLVGTTSLSGSSSNTVDIVGGNFKTFSNSGSIAGSTTATVLTLSSSVLGVYIVQANFGAQGNQIYTGMLIIAANANSFRIVTDGSGTNSVMTLSGANVQLANAIGSALDFTASAIFIGS